MKRWQLISLVFLYVLYHLMTLTVSPMPWLDEVIFKSITHSFAETRNFFCTAAPFVADKQVVQYGPVYFVLAATVEQIFGFGMFSFRILSLVSGFGLIWMLYTLTKLYYPKVSVYFVLTLLMFDPIVNSSMHGGRMDLMATGFMITSVYFLLFVLNEKNVHSGNLRMIFFSGLCAAMAVMTTSRVGVFLITPALLLIYRFLREPNKQRFMEGLIWAATILVPVILWMTIMFDGTQLQMSSYNPFGGNIFFKNEFKKYAITNLPLILFFLLFLALSVLRGWYKRASPLVVLSVGNILAFYLLIFENGGYYVIVLPFLYFIFYELISNLNAESKLIATRVALVLLLIFNCSVFAVKAANTAFASTERNTRSIDEFVRQHIPAGSKVVGDEIFYYSIVGAKSDFQLMNWYKNNTLREIYHREVYGYDYIIISEFYSRKKTGLLGIYQAGSDLELIGTYSETSSPKPRWLNGMSVGADNYSCSIYKRNDK